jgi:ADP-ribosylglycohydrolase
MSQTNDRLTRARWSVEGLSVGDAFGESLFFQGAAQYVTHSLETMIEQQILPASRWYYTDDTQMALSIVENLRKFGEIDQGQLAHSFGRHFEPRRGYGPAMYRLIPQFQAGQPWKKSARALFKGQGSFGNGGAMRVAPVGAYFADDLEAVVENARRSAEVTHAHPEASAGAIAVAVAAAWAWRLRDADSLPKGQAFLEMVLPSIPESEVRDGVVRAGKMPPDTSIWNVVRELGNGSRISAQDTAPFVLWCAAQHLDNYEEALWLTASGQGDMDTNCAMVGGIVAAHTGTEGIPAEWLRHREALPAWPFMENE